MDPKCSWALKHPEFFPVEVNTAGREELLRVPGVGTVSAKRILYARRARKLEHEDLRKLGGWKNRWMSQASTRPRVSHSRNQWAMASRPRYTGPQLSV